MIKNNYHEVDTINSNHILSVFTTTTMNYNCCKKIIGLL